jgi:ATP-dependent protease HslVU (ClpYQ) peptidase subunit
LTTIAWDGKTLAADSRLTKGTIIIDDATEKLFKIGEDEWFAGAGSWLAVQEVADWLTRRASVGASAAKPTISDDDGFSGFWWRQGRMWVLGTRLIACPSAPMDTMGSGGELALGAMIVGCDAVRAVEVAALRDVYTGGRVRSVELG